MKEKITLCIALITIFISTNLYGFDNGFIWSLKANFSGTLTMPKISKSDLATLTASYMKGGMRFFIDGEAELGYMFGSKQFFNMKSSTGFSGMSAFATLGVGQGAMSQQSGALIDTNKVDVYFNVSYTPVISFGIGTKAYFFDSKFAIGLTVGGKVIAAMTPSYEFYSNPSLEEAGIPPEVGTLIVTPNMIKKMNPVMGSVKLSFEYNQPILERLEIILGLYGRYNIYSPGYITMPPKLTAALEEVNPGLKIEDTHLKSYFINSLDFGITIGAGFKA